MVPVHWFLVVVLWYPGEVVILSGLGLRAQGQLVGSAFGGFFFTNSLAIRFTREMRTPIPISPSNPAGYDIEYECNGVGNLFIFFEPLRGLWNVVATLSVLTHRCYKPRWLDGEH